MRKVIGILSGAAGTLLVCFGLAGRSGRQFSLSLPFIGKMFGSDDGPTAVFIAGSFGDNSFIKVIMTGIALIVLTGILLIRKKR